MSQPSGGASLSRPRLRALLGNRIWVWSRRAVLDSGLLRTTVTFAAALTLGGVVLAVSGLSPLEVYGLLLEQSLLAPGALADTLLAATPLVFSGVATTLAFRAGVFNVGVEGAMYLGAFAAAWAGFTWVSLPGPVLVAAAFTLAGLAGGLWSAGPGYVKARYEVDEVVTTLLLNYVAISFTSYLVTYPFMSPGTANAMSPPIAPQARLARIWAPSQLNISLFIAFGVALAAAWLLHRTTLGYSIRAVGSNHRFAVAVGIPASRVVVVAMTLSGVIAGLGGAAQVLGVNYRFIQGFSPGYGYDGIAIALLAGNEPLGVLVGAMLFGALRTGGSTIQLFTNIPLDLIHLLEGIIILLVTARPALPRRWARSMGAWAGSGSERRAVGSHVA